MLNERFYAGSRKYDWEWSLRRYQISAEDQQLIREYINEKSVVDHIGDRRARKIGFTLVGWSRFISKPWREVSLNDLYAGIARMKSARAIRFKQTGETYDGGPLSQRTQYDYISILKPFLLWLIEKRVLGLSEREVVKKIRTPRQQDPSELIKASDIPSYDEIKRVIGAAPTIRDQALLWMLYESGARPGELGRAAWEDVKIDEYGVKFYITDTKTGKRRYSRLTISNAPLSALKDKHPAPFGGNFIFLVNDKLPMTYPGVARILKHAVEASGVAEERRRDGRKKITLKMFRHARATHMVQQNYNVSTIKQSLWNNLNSKMFQTYVSLGEEDIDREFLAKAGVKVDSDPGKVKAPVSVTCGNCHFVNQPEARYCNRCGVPLSGEALGSMAGWKDLIREAFKDPEPRREIFSDGQA